MENTEVQKPKYRNGSIQVRSKAAYWCLVPYWLTTVCVEALSQRVTLSLRCESQILGSRTVASIATTMHMTSSECGQTQTKTNGEWTNQWCRLYAPNVLVTVMQMQVLSISHRESSPNGSTNYTTTPKTKTDCKGWLYPCDVRAKSWDLGLQRASLPQCIWLPVSACGQTQTKTNGEWTNQWCRLYALDADASVVIISHRESSPNGSTNYTAAPKTKTRLHTPCHAKRLC